MRTWHFFLLFLFPAIVSAQIQQQVRQRSNAIEKPLGCYESLKQRGLQAQEAGNLNEAERLFREALQCREVQPNGRYRSELNILIARCEALRQASDNSGRGDIRGKGRFKPSASFLQNRDPNCYEMTLREADRAFRASLWEDAAALYRAAKVCADADQAKRQAMNDRIEQCRVQAENELLEKERQAVWQARQATASNRASDADDLLRSRDRTRAYRLADFANSYIAPEGANNPACLQIMFDAWYYDPALHLYDSPPFKVPFCYQLTDNLGANTQIRFAGTGSNSKIFVFSPEQHQLQIWQAGTIRPERTVSLDTNFQKFDVFPDGRTLLFISDQGYTFWRSNNQTYRINVPDGHCYQIDEDGRQFHYYDPESLSILTLVVQDVFSSGKAGQMQRSATPRPRVSGIPDQPALFRFRYPELWLVYPETILLLKKENSEDQWKRVHTWKLGGTTGVEADPDNLLVSLDPDTPAVIFSSGFDVKMWKLPAEPADSLLQPTYQAPVRLLATAQNGPEKAYWHYWEMMNSYLISIVEHADTVVSFQMLSPVSDYLGTQTGAFSEDRQWFAIANNEGAVKLWNLDNSSNTAIDSFPSAFSSSLSPDGKWAVTWEENRIAIFETQNLKKPYASIPRPEQNMPDVLLGNTWLAYRRGMDSIGVWNWNEDRHIQLFMAPSENAGAIMALGEAQDRIAYNVGDDSVEVRSLLNGQLIAAKKFDGIINHLEFLPHSDELLVVQNLTRSYFSDAQMIPRIWNITRMTEPARVVRLHGADIVHLNIDPNGRQIAFSDEYSIRLYNMDNLSDEALLLRPQGDKSITAMGFHPNGQALAAAYNDGTIIFWDTQNGHIQFKFNPAPGLSSNFIRRLSITEDGSTLRYITDRGHVISFLLSPDAIRNRAQDQYRQLTAFSSEDIRDYELATALEYPGNFERLASSGDLPLIRSFFDYYRTQAIGSNNISRVSDYCDRAFRLYIQLDESARQGLHATMLEMYADYAWKLVLRQRIREAASVAQILNDYFNNPLESRLIAAHAALLTGDFSNAAKYYTDWSIMNLDENPLHTLAFENLKANFLQSAEYGLLDDNQAGCICALFGATMDIGSICDKAQPVLAGDPETRLRWSIFTRLQTAEGIIRRAERAQLLRNTLEDIQSLRKRGQQEQNNGLLLNALNAIAQAYTAWSLFEYPNYRTVTRSKELEYILQNTTVPASFSSTVSWLKAANHLRLGDLYLIRGKLDSAAVHLKLAMAAADKVQPANGEETDRFNYELMGPLLEKTCLLELSLNHPAQAKTAIDMADVRFPEGLYTYLNGHLALVEGRFDAAWEAYYSGIYYEQQLGIACADIENIATYLPNMREAIMTRSPRLRDSLVTVLPNMDAYAVSYFYASRKSEYESYRGNWSEALRWSNLALQSTETAINKGKDSYFWREYWLAAQINMAYTLLLSSPRDTAALSRLIRYSEAADQYMQQEYPDYVNRIYLYSNLAHAYWLRNQPGDREAAVQTYQKVLEIGATEDAPADGWEMLQKDFRDFREAGIQWPELRSLLHVVAPDIIISDQEWQEMGLPPSER